MNNPLLIISLAIGTLTIVIAYLIIERIAVSKAKDEHTHSAVTETSRGCATVERRCRAAL